MVEPMGIDLGERQPLMTGAAGRMVGGGDRSSAGSDETRRAAYELIGWPSFRP